MSKSTPDPAFEQFLEFLKENRGFDFTGYKRSTLMRRVRKRMEEVGVGAYDAYQDRLEEHAEEFTALFNTILINVTGFFRDPDAWETLSRDFLPALLERTGPDAQVRVWSAGCASGEEAYTLVMALCEIMGVEAFRERAKVYATDVDDEALQQARMAVYPPKALEELPEALREKYFEPRSGQYAFRPDLRRLVIFGRHDLVRDAPISHLDLLVSRNALMYFNADTQTRILNRFHFALADGGILFMGKAEMMRSHGTLFAPLSLKARIFGKVPRTSLRDRLLAMGPPPRDTQAVLRGQLRLREAALDAGASAQLVVAPNGTVVMANAPARALFGLASDDVGRPLQDLTVSYRPVELRSRIEQATQERRPQHLPQIEHVGADGEMKSFDVRVVPLFSDGSLLGVSVDFVDVTGFQRLQAELQEANQELETAFEELQSTNEELETTNEELQSTNEELETINDELHRRTTELNDVNAYMRSILTSLRLAVVVLDRQSDIRVWNRQAEDLWGLRAEEVESHAFQNLDIGLPVERLKGAIRAAVEGKIEAEEMVLDAVNRRGRAIRCKVTCSPFMDNGRDVRGAVLVMEELRGDGASS